MIVTGSYTILFVCITLRVFYYSIIGLLHLLQDNVAKNNKTRFLYVLYTDKTWVFDQSERAQGPIYITNENKLYMIRLRYLKF